MSHKMNIRLRSAGEPDQEEQRSGFLSAEQFAYSCRSLNSGSRKQQLSFASLLPEVGQHKSAPSNTITEGEPLHRLRGEGSAL